MYQLNFDQENNFNSAVAKRRLCLPTNDKLTHKPGARKSHTSKTPDFFFSLCSEMKRSRERDGRVTLETQPRPPTPNPDPDPDNQTSVAHGSRATTLPTRVRPGPHCRSPSPVEPECREHQITGPDVITDQI
jgi:hypothetical protein